MPAVIVEVFISKVSSALSFSVTLKNTAPLVSLSSRCFPFFWNSALLSFWSVTIFVSSRPTEASPSEPVLIASPDWKRMLAEAGLEPPLASSILTVPSMRRSLMVVARYLLRDITTHTTTAATIAAKATDIINFILGDKDLILLTKPI